MYITALGEVKKIIPDMEGAKGVYKQVPISKENGTPTFSFRCSVYGSWHPAPKQFNPSSSGKLSSSRCRLT